MLATTMFAKRYQRPAFKVLIFHHHEKGLKLSAPASDNSVLPHQANSVTDHACSYLELLFWITQPPTGPQSLARSTGQRFQYTRVTSLLPQPLPSTKSTGSPASHKVKKLRKERAILNRFALTEPIKKSQADPQEQVLASKQTHHLPPDQSSGCCFPSCCSMFPSLQQPRPKTPLFSLICTLTIKTDIYRSLLTDSTSYCKMTFPQCWQGQNQVILTFCIFHLNLFFHPN